ncbi:unnamed protein product [Arabidopsis lyrata]|uniref:Pollen ole e 1 allergen and extensin family protein n=1 Tax=Arabidopsis lyrata subsp. lyrata TaxID=81972 RepID=D7MP26_ARALL|nr:uncharacterized protein LOC9301185 [Arabidopsis lyrata subsp. lyrata]EFH39587.1 hypothetical protein ARALYDRAFT_330672 [Arabidopsis lyrata subsp. lyrata]CAH8277925.1 unnamed protein product [Arabidopsis lyrata]|eukprot:XP_002863328.1 uncharacterized protein LOC9301185 [Arabidopsis lyrata subsp. lyrata]
MGSFFILLCFLLFSFFFFNGAFGNTWTRTEMVEMAGYGEQKLSSVIIAGSLLCDTSRPYLHSVPIPGATVAIKCQTGSKRRSKWIKAVTDELGEFEIDLPSQLHAIPDLENKCFIKPVYVPRHYRCYHTSTNIHKRIKLVSSTNGLRVYTSGKIRLQGHTSRS